MKKTLTIGAVIALAGVASAQYNVNLGTLNINDAPQTFSLNGASIPAGAYTSFEVSLDWVAGGGNPWSSEAIFALVSGPAPFAGTETFYADPGVSPDALDSGDSVTLTWTGFLDETYNGGDDLFFAGLQTFGGSDAVWNNVDITLGFDTAGPVMAPMSIALGANPSSMTEVPLNTAEVTWFTFDVTDGNGALPWSISTAGSTNTGGAFADDDTELGLYDAAGNLIATNDDEDFGAGILTSLIDSTGTGTLADGTYYIAAGSFNTTFGDGFDAVSESTAVGTTKLTVSFVPAPGAAALLGLAGVAGLRRRRA